VIDDRYTWLSSQGRVEGLGQALKSLKLVGGEGDSAVTVAARQSRSLREWEATYGMTAEEWLERYGDPRESRPTRQRLPEASATTRRRAPDVYPQRRRGTYADTGVRPRAAARRGSGYEAPGAARSPANFAQRSRERNQKQQYDAFESRDWEQRTADEDWDGSPRGRAGSSRPSYGSMLQPDGRSPEYEQVQSSPDRLRKGDVMQSDEAW
jgi:hypothetical protein